MFAGAAREAVFSNPEVIRRVNAEFVPVALKAALVNSPPDDAEGRLYQEIGRSKPAPQGICVVNAAGKVLDWTLMFDNDPSVLTFLDHARRRFRDHPDAQRPVAAERYMRFPSMKLPEVADSGAVLPVPDRHARTGCPAQARFRPGTVIARLVGRALGPDGQPGADTRRQEQYVEDRFDVPLETQALLAKKLAEAGATRFRAPDELARLFVSHAFLGQLDVNPCGSPGGGSGELRQNEFWLQRAGTPVNGAVPLRIEGRSEVAGGQDASRRGGGSDGRVWQHQVKLTWEGFIDMHGDRVTRLLLAARGSEKLQWGNPALQGDSDVARLPAGHPIDLAGEVRYGIIGEPVAGREVGAAGLPAPAASPEVGPDLMAALGPPGAVVLNPVVQYDLKLSGAQRRKLQQSMTSVAAAFRKVIQDTQGLPPGDREKRVSEFRQETSQKLGAVLASVLRPDQQKRLRQIALQQEGLFALGDPEVASRLGVSDVQRKKLVTLVQQTQRRFQALQQKAQASGHPAEMQQEAVRVRTEQEAKIGTLLTRAQQTQWKAMLGRPLARGDAAGIQARFQRKMQQVQAGVRRWQAQGRDPSPVAGIMQDFEPLMRAGRLGEAEAVLDRALALVGETKYDGRQRPRG